MRCGLLYRLIVTVNRRGYGGRSVLVDNGRREIRDPPEWWAALRGLVVALLLVLLLLAFVVFLVVVAVGALHQLLSSGMACSSTL